MKKISTTIALCFLVTGLAFAQTKLPIKPKAATTNSNSRAATTNSTSKGETPRDVAEELCNCFNNFFNQYHPAIRSLVEDMALHGEEKALEAFQKKVMNMSQEEQQKVIADAQKFAEDANNPKSGMANCIQIFQTKTSKMSEKDAQKILDELEASPSCKTIDELIKIGTKGK